MPDMTPEPVHEVIRLQVQHAHSVAFTEIRDRANTLEKLFSEQGIRLSGSSGLGGYIRKAKLLASAWENGERPENFPKLMVAASHLDGIAQACLGFCREPEGRALLKRLLVGNLDPFDRVPSQGKDALWEMELGYILRRQRIDVRPGEPDLLMRLAGTNVGVACKKIYSEKGARKAFSTGVEQIRRSGLHGILAVNIDDTLAPGAYVVAPDLHNFFGAVDNLCVHFANRHHNSLSKYLARGRSMAAIISASCFGRVAGQIESTTQILIWTHPGLSAEKQGLVDLFREQLMGHPGALAL